MRGEESYNQRSSRGCGGDDGRNSISRSRALGVIALILALFIFQVSVFTVNTVKQARAKKQEQVCFYPNSSASGQSGITVGTPMHEGAIASRAKNRRKTQTVHLFAFDPNTIPLDSLCLLGFSPKQAQTIINYRNKGGIFRKKEDFARMYVVSEERYAQLSSYIFIPTEQMKRRPVANRADSASDYMRNQAVFEKTDGEEGREKEAMEAVNLLGKGEKKR